MKPQAEARLHEHHVRKKVIVKVKTILLSMGEGFRSWLDKEI